MEIEKEVKKVRLLNWSRSKGLVAETFGNALKGIKPLPLLYMAKHLVLQLSHLRANEKAWLHLLSNRKRSLIGSKA